MATPIPNGANEITLNKSDFFNADREKFKGISLVSESVHGCQPWSVQNQFDQDHFCTIIHEQWTHSYMEILVCGWENKATHIRNPKQ